MDPLRKVVPGDSPAALLNAERFNVMSDVARWWRARANGPQGAGTDEAMQALPRLEVWVRYTSTLPIYAVVKPTAALIDPVAVPENALAWPAFDVSAPASEDDLVLITTMPHPGGTEIVRRAIISGVAVVEVEMEDEAHEFARPIPGSVFRLKSAETGSIRLLPDAADSGSGSGSGAASIRNRLVLMGGSASSGGSSTSSNCGPGIGWTAGLRSTSCLDMRVISQSGDCGTLEELNTQHTLFYDSVQQWWALDPDLDLTFSIAGRQWTAKFQRATNGGLPLLSLIDAASVGSIGSFFGVLDCSGVDEDGNPYAIYAFGDPLMCDGGGSGSGSGSGGTPTECDNIVRVKVTCKCPRITVLCCPNSLPRTLYLSVSGGSGIPATYGDLGGGLQGWCWSNPFADELPVSPHQLALYCTAGGVWQLGYVAIDQPSPCSESFNGGAGAAFGAPDSVVCDPFLVTNNGTSSNFHAITISETPP